jgi:hypothetical protein
MPATRSGSLPPNSGAHQTSGWPSATTQSARSTNDCSVRFLAHRHQRRDVDGAEPAALAGVQCVEDRIDGLAGCQRVEVAVQDRHPRLHAGKPLRSHIASTKNLVAQFGNDIGA